MSNFDPKLTKRSLGFFPDPTLAGLFSKNSPWQYLKDWQQSDRGYDPLELEYINKRMQDRYPGKYKIVKKSSEYGRFTYYDFEFETPAAETMFKLKYSK